MKEENPENIDVERFSEHFETEDKRIDVFGKTAVLTSFLIMGSVILFIIFGKSIVLRIMFYASLFVCIVSLFALFAAMCITEYKVTKTFGMTLLSIAGLIFTMGFLPTCLNYYLMGISGIIALVGMHFSKRYVYLEMEYRKIKREKEKEELVGSTVDSATKNSG